jgi:hypothetical protein
LQTSELLVQIQPKKLRIVVNLLKGEAMKVLFLDMDNTIAENTTCRDIPFKEGLYLNKRPIWFVIEAVNTLIRPQIEKLIIITQVQGGFDGRREKMLWLNKHDIEFDKLIQLDGGSKSDSIIDYCNTNGFKPSECLLIDDKKEILQDADQKGICVMYPQQLITDYYEFLMSEING